MFRYVASAFANTSSRKLLTIFPSPILLTFTQFMTASLLLTMFKGSSSSKLSTPSLKSIVLSHSRPSNRLEKLLLKLSVVYSIGFIFVNAGYVYVNVSLAETLRAAEPLVSVGLVKLFLPSEKTNYLMMFSMVPIFFGGLLSSLSDTSFSLIGLVFVTISNISFSTRSLLTKQIKNISDIDAFSLFLTISKVGSLFLGVLLCLELFLGELNSFEVTLEELKVLAVNNFFYFLYNQMSFYVLSNVSMVSHAVANALRRIVTIMFSVWYFRNEITQTNGIGICCAIVGLLLYSYSKSNNKVQTQELYLSNEVKEKQRPLIPPPLGFTQPV